jgi:hypothetical protein
MWLALGGDASLVVRVIMVRVVTQIDVCTRYLGMMLSQSVAFKSGLELGVKAGGLVGDPVPKSCQRHTRVRPIWG